MFGTHGNWKNSLLELPAKLPIQPIWPNFAVNRLNWQCCFTGSYRAAPRIFFFHCYGCWLVIWAEFHWDPSPHIFWTYWFILRQCEKPFSNYFRPAFMFWSNLLTLILLWPAFQFQKQLGNFYCDGIRQNWILPWQDRLLLSHLTWECLNLSSSLFIQHFATSGFILVSSF